MVGKHICSAQHDLDHIIVRRELAAPDIVQRRFKHMGETNQRLKAERTGPALDRMYRSEHGINGLRVGLTLLHSQQSGFELGQLLFAFLKECDLDRF